MIVGGISFTAKIFCFKINNTTKDAMEWQYLQDVFHLMFIEVKGYNLAMTL